MKPTKTQSFVAATTIVRMQESRDKTKQKSVLNKKTSIETEVAQVFIITDIKMSLNVYSLIYMNTSNFSIHSTLNYSTLGITLFDFSDYLS